MGNFTLKKKERITKKSEFLKIGQNGVRYKTQNFLIIIFSRKNSELRRLGISVSKKVGGAVKRNRVKRLLREFFRLNKGQLPAACDFLFVAKPGAAQLNFSALSQELMDFFKGFN